MIFGLTQVNFSFSFFEKRNTTQPNTVPQQKIIHRHWDADGLLGESWCPATFKDPGTPDDLVFDELNLTYFQSGVLCTVCVESFEIENKRN